MPPFRSDATRLLTRIVDGDETAAAELTPLIYAQLRGMAARLLRSERKDHTLQPTALVHEAYVRLAGADDAGWRGRTHFAAVAAQSMRKILIDHARRKRAGKRGGAWDRVTMQGLQVQGQQHPLDLLALDEALISFAEEHPRQARIVELRFFGDLTGEEIADVVGVSRRTVVKDLAMAQAWLLLEMDDKTDA